MNLTSYRTVFSRNLIFGSFVFLLLMHQWFTFAGFYNGDDINYARYAGRLAFGPDPLMPNGDHFQLRWMPIILTAFFYKIFGVTAFSSALYSTICVVLCGWLLHELVKREPLLLYLSSLSLFFFARATIFYSHRVLADEGIALVIFAAYFLYRSYLASPGKFARPGVLLGLLLVAGIITKESIILAIPLFGYLFVNDMLKKRNQKFWLAAAITMMLLLLCYAGFFKLTTGDFLYRYHVLVKNSYMNICSFDKLPASATFKRVGYQLWEAMLLNGDFLIILPALAAAFYVSRLFKPGVQRLDFAAFCILLASANFMTVSFSSYVPLCHDPRHFLFLIPFAALIGSRILHAFFQEPKRYMALPILFSIATVVIFMVKTGDTKYLYFLLASGLVVFCFIKLPAFVGWTLLTAVLSINYLLDFIKPLYPYYHDNKYTLSIFREKPDMRGIVYSDGFSAEMAEFYTGFKQTKIAFKSMDSLDTSSNQPQYYLLERHVSDPNLTIDSLLQTKWASHIKLIREKGSVSLYSVHISVLEVIAQQKTSTSR